MEGGEWSNFSVVCVNEEADFMAQLFPNPNDVVHVGYDGHHQLHSNNFHSIRNNNNNNNDNGSYYSSDSNSNSQNLYGFSQERSFNNYLGDCHDHPHHHHHHHHQALPIDFLHCQSQMEDDNGLTLDINGGNLEESQMDPPTEDKISDFPDISKKRPRVPDVQIRGKRNVRGKKSQKVALGGEHEEEENELNGVNNNNNDNINNGQSSSSGSLEDDCSSKGTISTALNSNGKTRASRGSATDPQSLYARKRRERINERLRILQGLVPNGTKVDISTMLEEAVQYVKFLQLQIKLLSSDEMWMYAPLAYNGMNLGLDFNINTPR